jgi:hypothetical protein
MSEYKGERKHLRISLQLAQESLSNPFLLTEVSKNTKETARYGAQTEEKYQYNGAIVIFLPSLELMEGVLKRK